MFLNFKFTVAKIVCEIETPKRQLSFSPNEISLSNTSDYKQKDTFYGLHCMPYIPLVTCFKNIKLTTFRLNSNTKKPSRYVTE